MDPVTAAGIGLSVTSLAIQLFTGCIKGYQILLDVVDMPKEFEHLRVRMRLEQMRLLNWGHQVGLLEDMLEEPSLVLHLHRNLIFDILLQISHLLKACLKIEAKFAQSTGTAENAITTVSQPVTGKKISKVLSFDTLLKKAINVVSRSDELPTRLQWAMVKQDEFQRLIGHLISFNDSIISLLDGASLRQIREMQTEFQLTLLQLSTKIDDLNQLTQATRIKPIRDSPNRGLHGYSLPGLLAGIEETEPSVGALALARLTAFKADRLTIEQSSLVTKDALTSDEVVIVKHCAGIDIAKYKTQEVWIEWKESDTRHPNPWWDSLVEQRVKKLAQLLGISETPQEFRAPQCLGYFKEVDEDGSIQYGFVNRIPTNAASSSTPRSLLHLIRYEQTSSLTSRIQLAVILTGSLMYLHSVNWLHKGIRGQNVIFLTPETTNTIDYKSPILAGFEYARPDLPDEVTEKPQSILEYDIYRHPDSLAFPKARSKKSWDIYSLGVVLIEIGLWKPIGDLLGIDFTHPTAKSKVRKAKTQILDEAFLHKIGTQCGERYREVVRSCITAADDESAEDNNATATNAVGQGRSKPQEDTRDHKNENGNESETEAELQASLDMMRLLSQDILGGLQKIQL